MNHPTSEIVAKAVAGDQAALSHILLDYHVPLLEFVAKRMSPSLKLQLAVDDILQQVYIHAFRDIRRFVPQGEGAVWAWLKSLAEHRILDAVKLCQSQKRGGLARRLYGVTTRDTFVDDLLGELAIDEATPSRHMARQEAIDAIHIAMACLPAEQRQAVQCRYLEGLSLIETAAKLQTSTGSVRGLLDRAKQHIREYLQNASAYLSTKS